MSKNKNKSPFSAPIDYEDVGLLAYALNRLYAESNQIWLSELRPHGLTAPRWQVLSILLPFDGSRIGTIAELSGTDQPILSRVIDQMERDGLVERRPSEKDSRAVEVWITDKGRDIHARLMPAANQFIKRMTDGFSEDEKNELMKFMTRMLNNLKD